MPALAGAAVESSTPARPTRLPSRKGVASESTSGRLLHVPLRLAETGTQPKASCDPVSATLPSSPNDDPGRRAVVAELARADAAAVAAAIGGLLLLPPNLHHIHSFETV